MQENEFDDLPDITPKGTIREALPHVFVHSDKPLALILQHAGIAGNPAFANAKPKFDHEYDLAVQRGDVEAQKQLTSAFYADNVVVGWENCNGKDGQPLPYSPEAARFLFSWICKRGGEDELSDTFNAARNKNNFRASPAAIAATLGK